jgi:hypothetical protein
MKNLLLFLALTALVGKFLFSGSVQELKVEESTQQLKFATVSLSSSKPVVDEAENKGFLGLATLVRDNGIHETRRCSLAEGSNGEFLIFVPAKDGAFKKGVFANKAKLFELLQLDLEIENSIKRFNSLPPIENSNETNGGQQ